MNPFPHHHHGPGQSDDLSDNNGSSDSIFNELGDITADPLNQDSFSAQGLDSSQLGTIATPAGTAAADGGSVMEVTYASTGLTFNVTYDSTITALMSSNMLLYNEYTGAIKAAVNYYQSEFTNQATINITFGYGEENGHSLGTGAAGMSGYTSGLFSYATFYSAAQNALDGANSSAVQKAAFATLPTSDPTGGSGLFAVSDAEEKVLNLGSNTGVDGYVGISSSLAFSWTQPNTVNTNYDAVGVLEHEISEVMGRSDFLGEADGNNQLYTLLDFFHYAAAGGSSTAAPGSAAGVLNEPFVSGYNSALQSYFSYNGTTVTLPYDTPSQVAAGDDVADWTNSVQSDSYGFANQGQTGLISPTDLEEMNILGYNLACFLPRTQIATPSGEVAVETLKIGDLILTHGGEAKPVTWIGFGKALTTRGRRNAATPVIVQRGALAENVPNYELRITKGHSLFIDGVLIPVEFLVNHRSIIWDDRAMEVEFYHVEVDGHDVLLANGAAAETYRDDGNRWMFRNADSGRDQPAKAPCAPVLTGGPVVDAIWRRLLARSGPRPGLPLTADPDLHLLVDGRRVDGRTLANGVRTFRLASRPAEVHIVSRAGAQDELGLARDPRVLGVALRQIIIWQGRHATLIEADDARLSDGFHPFEADNGFRWTNGDAVLPRALFGGPGGAMDVELHIGCTTQYPLFGDAALAAA